MGTTIQALREWATSYKDVVVCAGVILAATSAALAAATYYRNGAIERDRWRAHLAVQAIAMDAHVAISDVARLTDSAVAEVVHPGGARDPQPQAPPAGTAVLTPVTAQATVAPVSSSTQTIHLLFRNSSFRPATIVRVFMRDSAGRDVGPDWRTNMGRLGLPLAVDPWRTQVVAVPMDGGDYQRAAVLVIGDADDREAQISLGTATPWRKWLEFP